MCGYCVYSKEDTFIGAAAPNDTYAVLFLFPESILQQKVLLLGCVLCMDIAYSKEDTFIGAAGNGAYAVLFLFPES